MKNRFNERKGHFVKGRGWVCDDEAPEQPVKNGNSNGNYTMMTFSQQVSREKPAPRVTSRFKSMKQPGNPRATRITMPSPRLRW